MTAKSGHTWLEEVSKTQGYDIYRSSKSNSGFEKIAAISSGATLTYTDKDVTSGNTYYYKIAATYKIKGSLRGRKLQ